MKRSALPRRSGPIPRQSAKQHSAYPNARSTITGVRKPVKHKKRTLSEYARIYGSKERVAWVKSLPCFECGDRAGVMFNGAALVIVNAHTKNEGASRKGHHTTIVPLCSATNGLGCHDAQHQHGWSVLSTLDTIDKREAAAADIARQWARTLNRE